MRLVKLPFRAAVLLTSLAVANACQPGDSVAPSNPGTHLAAPASGKASMVYVPSDGVLDWNWYYQMASDYRYRGGPPADMPTTEPCCTGAGGGFGQPEYFLSDFELGLITAEYGLNAAEERLVESNPTKWIPRRSAMRMYANAATNQSKSRFNGMDRDGHQENAWKHALWACYMTRAWGAADAKAWTDAHEDLPNNPPDLKAMDLHNNAVGIAHAGTTANCYHDIEAAQDELAWVYDN